MPSKRRPRCIGLQLKQDNLYNDLIYFHYCHYHLLFSPWLYLKNGVQKAFVLTTSCDTCWLLADIDFDHFHNKDNEFIISSPTFIQILNYVKHSKLNFFEVDIQINSLSDWNHAERTTRIFRLNSLFTYLNPSQLVPAM